MKDRLDDTSFRAEVFRNLILVRKVEKQERSLALVAHDAMAIARFKRFSTAALECQLLVA